MLAYTPAQVRRCSVLRPDWTKTREVRSLYPPAGQDLGYGPVVVAWDPLGPTVGSEGPLVSQPNSGRWCLAYESVGHFATDDTSLQKKKVYRIFYYWQGQGSTYLEANTGKIAKWLKDHDMWSGDHCGEWSDRMFTAEDNAADSRMRSNLSENEDHIREILDIHKEELSNKFGTTSHNGGRGPNNGSKYYGGIKAPSRLRRWIDRSATA